MFGKHCTIPLSYVLLCYSSAVASLLRPKLLVSPTVPMHFLAQTSNQEKEFQMNFLRAPGLIFLIYKMGIPLLLCKAVSKFS